MDDRFVVRVPWGTFGHGGSWRPNPLLKLSEAEQWRQNEASGYHAQSRSQEGVTMDQPNCTDMPTVDELRQRYRATLAKWRENGCRPERLNYSEEIFCERELGHLGAIHVYREERRRHDLIVRGYTPPEDLSAPAEAKE